MMFVATADAQGHPECSYKGGLPGFVQVLDDRTLAFPDYDGNGMYRSWGNVLVNPAVGLLFLDFEAPKRLRVNGSAQIRTTIDCAHDLSPGYGYHRPRKRSIMILSELSAVSFSTNAALEYSGPTLRVQLCSAGPSRWKRFDMHSRDALPWRESDGAQEGVSAGGTEDSVALDMLRCLCSGHD